MVRTQIQLSESQARRLKQMAKAGSVSMAELIRRSVDQLLQSERVADPDSVRKKAAAAAGKFHAGTGDLAEAHDDYLEEVYGDGA